MRPEILEDKEEAEFVEDSIDFAPGDIVRKGGVEATIIQRIPNSPQLRISLDEGKIEEVNPEDLELVKRCEEAHSPKPKATIDFEDLGCILCHDILCEPLSLPCGHTFCRLCVALTLQRSAKKCPTCRSNCHITPSIQPVNMLIANLCKKFFPLEYDRKLKETAEQMEKLSRMHPIFFYNDFQFPGSTMGLTLFEPRYKIMIRRVISADQKFIYLPSFQGYRAEIGQIGFLCTVTSCEFDVQDRAFLSMTCHERIIVTNTWVEQGTANLHFAEYDFYNDTGDTAVSDEAKSQFENGLYSDMTQFYRDNIENANLQHHFPSPPDISDLDKAIWWCAKFLNMLRNLPNQKGRDLLRTRSIAERLELLGNIRFRIGRSESSGSTSV